jgi:hypothetical protein
VRRRTLLGTGAAALALGVAGCTDGSDGGDGDGGPQTLNVEALDASPDDAATTLSVAYDYRTQDILSYDGGFRESPGTITLFVCQFRVVDDGEASTRVRPEMFQVADPDEDRLFTRQTFDDPDHFPDRRLDPGDVATGWMAFEVPSVQDFVLLAVNQGALPAPAGVRFSETDLEFTVEDGATRTPVPGGTAGTTTATEGTAE